MADAYKLLKHIVYGAVFENVAQDNNRVVLTRAEIENYAETTFDKVCDYLRTGRSSGSFSDLQCTISMEASRIFKADRNGNIEFKRTNVGVPY